MKSMLSWITSKQIVVLTAAVVGLEVVIRVARSYLSKVKAAKEDEDYIKVLFFPDSQVSCRAHFTQRHGCVMQRCRFSHNPNSSYAQLLGYFKNVRRCVDLCVYTITCVDLAEVIADLHAKGIIVRVITDNKEVDAAGSQVDKFRREGIQVRHNLSSYLMHHKFIVIDKQLLITGSFNWTRQAITGNCENLVITNNQQLRNEFSKEFEKLWDLYDPKLQAKQILA